MKKIFWGTKKRWINIIKWNFEMQKRIAYERDNKRCARCGQELSFIDAVFHHIKFRSDGGSDEAKNLLTSCFQCEKDFHRGKL